MSFFKIVLFEIVFFNYNFDNFIFKIMINLSARADNDARGFFIMFIFLFFVFIFNYFI